MDKMWFAYAIESCNYKQWKTIGIIDWAFNSTMKLDQRLLFIGKEWLLNHFYPPVERTFKDIQIVDFNITLATWHTHTHTQSDLIKFDVWIPSCMYSHMKTIARIDTIIHDKYARMHDNQTNGIDIDAHPC